MSGSLDYYAVLGLSPQADDVVVHAAWKALLRKHHPDTNASDRATERAREINEAFAVLGKPDSRADYDRARGGRPVIAPYRQSPPIFRPAPPRPRACSPDSSVWSRKRRSRQCHRPGRAISPAAKAASPAR
jgi:curved DNA-binding protein CbpA